MASTTDDLEPGTRREFGLAMLAISLVCAVAPFRDLQRRSDLAWAAPAKISSPTCTTYSFVLTWCSATVGAAPNAQSVHHVHLLPPGFYGMFGPPSPFKTEKGRMTVGLVDPRDGYVTTSTALEFAGARLGSALLFAALGLLVVIYWSLQMRRGPGASRLALELALERELSALPRQGTADRSAPRVGQSTFGRRRT
jgi:hypothetical protein